MTQLTATSLCLVQDIQDYVSLTLGHRVDIYSFTHTVHSLNGSKSHTVRDTKLDNIWRTLTPVSATVVQGFIQTPRGVITPWFLCNTP